MKHLSKYNELFGLFKKKLITESDIEMISDLFLEISDEMTEVETGSENKWGYSNGLDDVKNDSWIIYPVGELNGYGNKFYGVHVDIKLHTKLPNINDIESDENGPLSGISWLDPKLDDKLKKLRPRLDSFAKRLRKFGFKYKFIEGGATPEFIRIIIKKA